ncbi:KH domain-containing protein [Leptospira bandrabouensis]|uniref:RNA-binding protein KhpA n=1 Tax=Leptospira bandrabouensis TaxID=2484903 RepID=A0A6H3NQT6_9LEPT|nr:KH domain-containing protein [Leptospira bandrabouensis]MCG6145532.1 KH domain-containing protein [Leptospira bandrabouensis]MCG6152563.1 KH domain-containing protein [Leptospira bandrabouensis]MCG6161156.1 KH domain-containing protein [Leptospira bandrabouensis]MCG6164720.1 KH domain-containing protein [Leptospira bandrabouensis]MCW7459105.1 KH domain-containing protein [Leptospira bandrabouensis]
MESLVRYIVTSLVDQPEQVAVNQVPGEEETVIELRVAPKDLGKVIGKNGRIAKSLRTVLQAAGTKQGKNYTLEIVD